MKIENAQYHHLDGDKSKPKASITCTIDGVTNSVPISVGNAEYDEIMRQVADKKLTIKEAD
tara:strand:- start:28 stop:210 length:183 start_codon:yes stop_codon:yes gene_type:complete